MSSAQQSSQQSTSGSPARKLVIALLILAVSGAAGWGAFAFISQRSGYAEEMQRFQTAEAKLAREQVRLVPPDRSYHRAFHRRDEGYIGTLPQAARLGYEPCRVCSPPLMPPLPSRPRAWGAGIGTFVLWSAVLLATNGRRLGIGLVVDSKSTGAGGFPPNRMGELSDQFELLCAMGSRLIKRLAATAPPGVEDQQAQAFAIALLRWGARWTHRELDALKDIEHLEESVAPQDVSEDVSKADVGVAPWERTEGGRWLQQQFEYLQLLWKVGEPSTDQARLAARRRLLDHLAANAHAGDPQTGATSDPPVLEDLTAIMAASVDFFHKHYEPDSHLRSRRNRPRARRT